MVTMFVQGTPVPKGSMSGRVVKCRGRDTAMVYDQQGTKLKKWQEKIKWAAIEHRDSKASDNTKVGFSIKLYFQIPRPKGHTGKKGNPTKDYRPFPTVKPDIDKLTRAVLDALTGTIYHDDSQVTSITAYKRYATPEGVWIQIKEETNDT